jgi:hypothetical protein
MARQAFWTNPDRLANPVPRGSGIVLTAGPRPVTLRMVVVRDPSSKWRVWAAALLAVGLAACGANLTASPEAPDVPTARLGAAMTADPAPGTVLLFGGKSRSSVEGDTWQWRAGGWRRVETRGPAPPARSFAGVAPDGRGGVLLFGGDPSDPDGPHDDTWRWDGTRWSQLHPATVPDHGAFRTMAQGPDGAPVLVVSAQDHTVQTWVWDGGNWRRAGSDTAPPWLDEAALVLDRAARRLLLVGGTSANGQPAGDTWAWDGQSWSALRTAHRPAGGPAAGIELATGPLLVEQDGTWTWSAGDWTLAEPAGQPRWRPYAGLAAVPGATMGGVLAIQLTGSPGDPGDTWRWNGFGWTGT